MKKLTCSIFINLVVILLASKCYCQEQKKITIHFEGGYQFWKDKTYCAGVGAKMDKPLNCKLIDYYTIHASLYFEKYLKPDNLNNNSSLTSRISYEFKFISIGFYARYFITLQDNEFRLDLAPEIGVGYKYLWILYSRNILIYQDQRIPIAKDNFRILINIPLLKMKI